MTVPADHGDSGEDGVGEKRWEDNGKRVMGAHDQRVEGRLTRRLRKLAREIMDPDDILDPDKIEIKRGQHRYDMPDCGSCEERCCVHKEPGMGMKFIDIADEDRKLVKDYIREQLTGDLDASGQENAVMNA